MAVQIVPLDESVGTSRTCKIDDVTFTPAVVGSQVATAVRVQCTATAPLCGVVEAHVYTWPYGYIASGMVELALGVVGVEPEEGSQHGGSEVTVTVEGNSHLWGNGVQVW